RDPLVTGVQTCALPISRSPCVTLMTPQLHSPLASHQSRHSGLSGPHARTKSWPGLVGTTTSLRAALALSQNGGAGGLCCPSAKRSEERRVGEGGGARVG